VGYLELKNSSADCFLVYQLKEFVFWGFVIYRWKGLEGVENLGGLSLLLGV
jgi:hypothetical protein